MKAKAIIIKTDGINRDDETKFTFELAGATANIVHINDLRSKKEKLSNYNILALPGGFSYGDDVVSGKILAVELFSFFKDELQKFIDRKDTAVIGICNGFQVLVRTGILPFRELGKMSATLTNNDSGHFECRWINVKVDPKTNCVFLKNLKEQTFDYPIAHGEGKFFTDGKTLHKIENEHQVAFRYVNGTGLPTQEYPYNPNGSLNAIVGITDSTGRVLGLMPHPECFIRREQHPNWRRMEIEKPHGLLLFNEIVNFVKQS